MRFYPLNGCAVRCPPPEAGIFRLSRQARGRSLQPFLSRFAGEVGRSRRGEAAHTRHPLHIARQCRVAEGVRGCGEPHQNPTGHGP